MFPYSVYVGELDSLKAIHVIVRWCTRNYNHFAIHDRSKTCTGVRYNGVVEQNPS